jgi:hypothetical protein
MRTNLGRYVAENLSFLGCFAKSSGKWLMMFQRSAVPLFSGKAGKALFNV